jgi:hypothetical protein
MIGKSIKNENRLGQSKMSTDNHQESSPRNATPPRGIEPIAQEPIRKEKMTMVLLRHKTGYPQDMGETELGRSERSECHHSFK